MRLLDVRVTLYRNIVDSGPVEIDESITGLIGKNESGKTAFLQALYSLNPAWPSTVETDVIRDYPRWRVTADGKTADLEDVKLVTGCFELSSDEFSQLREATSLPIPDSLESVDLRASRSYSGQLSASFSLSPSRFGVVVSELDAIPEDLSDALRSVTTISELTEAFEQIRDEVDFRTKTSKPVQEASRFLGRMNDDGEWDLSGNALELVESLLPTFFYYPSYSELKGRIDLEELSGKDPADYTEEDQTAAALLALAGVEGTQLMSGDFEVRTARLEAAANEITNQIFEYRVEKLVVIW